MQNVRKAITAIVIALVFIGIAKANNPTAPEGTQEKVVVVKNTSEKSIAIFAGPKEGIRDPKINTYGGMSTNKVYVYPNDVVCLMTVEKKPVACTVVKTETTSVEINTSGTTITGK